MSEEFLDVVDENDNVIGRDTRQNVHRSRSRHRGIHVLVFNRKGELLLQLRGAKTEKCPGKYDLSVSEHVRSGETYGEAVKRGLLEELGITGARPEKLLHFRMNYGDPHDNMTGVVYKIVYDGKLVKDEKDVSRIVPFPLKKIRGMLASEKDRFSGWAYELLRWYLGLESKVDKL